MNGQSGNPPGMPQLPSPHDRKPDLAQIQANMMQVHHAASMSGLAGPQPGFYNYGMVTSPPPGMMHSPVSSIGSPGG